MAQTWQPLPPMAHAREEPGAAAVAGGLVVAGGALSPFGEGADVPDELYDEASGRWFELPHAMAEPRLSTRAVSLPAAALGQRAPAAGATAGP